jgi:hypothetical protein
MTRIMGEKLVAPLALAVAARALSAGAAVDSVGPSQATARRREAKRARRVVFTNESAR